MEKSVKQFYLSILIIAMSLGTAWAIRGQFGHEHGAAWAGSIGSLAVLLVIKREDWLRKAFSIVLAGAVGWGLGGMMSYGMVVGYGRGSDWPNVFYGLAMLFIIGGLYGFLGGGLFGLALSDTKKYPVKWAKLIVEMTIGGIICYFFIIEQFGWNMTPPRSELWAVCLGMAFALAWNIRRGKNKAAIRVAIFSSLGAGFGFAFGNFLQVMGQVSQIHFNFWNVMEYTLGFFGGLGLAYGTLTSEWEKEESTSTENQNFQLVVLVLVIPFIMWQQNFELDRIESTFLKLFSSNNSVFNQSIQWFSLLFILIVGVYWIFKFRAFENLSFRDIKVFFFGHWALYIALSFMITGAFVSIYRPEQYLYLVNLVMVFFFIQRAKPQFSPLNTSLYAVSKYLVYIFIFISILAYTAIHSHGELKGARKRFGDESLSESVMKVDVPKDSSSIKK